MTAERRGLTLQALAFLAYVLFTWVLFWQIRAGIATNRAELLSARETIRHDLAEMRALAEDGAALRRGPEPPEGE